MKKGGNRLNRQATFANRGSPASRAEENNAEVINFFMKLLELIKLFRMKKITKTRMKMKVKKVKVKKKMTRIKKEKRVKMKKKRRKKKKIR